MIAARPGAWLRGGLCATALLCATLATGADLPPPLGLPVDCTPGRTCWVQQYLDHDASPAARDYACGGQSYDGHDGTDIRLRDTAARARVIAAAPGTVLAVRDGVPDHLARSAAERAAVAGRECGNGVLIDLGGGWQTQYCHLAQGSIAVKPGDRVTIGQTLGAVGSSGLAEFPHLHLTLRHDGEPVDPFRGPGAASGCGAAQDALWRPEVLAALAYRPAALLRVGFASGPVKLPKLEEGSQPDVPPDPDWPALVGYAWAINLAPGDVIAVTVDGPGGLAARNSATMDRAKAQYLLFTGLRRPATGWPKGAYTGRITLQRGAETPISESWTARLD